jgi:hypothetical protein
MKTPRFSPAMARATRTLGTVAVLAASSLAMPRSAAAQDEIEFPESGTPSERAKKLWHASRTRVLADAEAALSDAEYQKRRAPIWGAWTRLQMSVAGQDDRVDEIIPDVLGLLNDVYGWTAFPPAKRQEIRDRTRPSAPKRVAAMDERLAALK